MIVDAQIHRPIPLKPWPEFDSYGGYENAAVVLGEGTETSFRVSAELAIASMEAVGVDAAVVDSHPEFCAVATATYPDKLAAVLDFYDPAALNDPQERVKEFRTSRVVAIRLLPGTDRARPGQAALLADGHWDPLLAAAQTHGLPVIFFVQRYLRLLPPVARRFPQLKMIVNHFGMPIPRAEDEFAHSFDDLPELLSLAAFDNVAVQASALPALVADPYPFSSIWPRLHRAIDAFGSDRVMWGSDFQRVTGRMNRAPSTPLKTTNYAELLDYILYTGELGATEKAMLLGGAARKWFGWPTDP
jgi:L-fuconolactonase